MIVREGTLPPQSRHSNRTLQIRHLLPSPLTICVLLYHSPVLCDTVLMTREKTAQTTLTHRHNTVACQMYYYREVLVLNSENTAVLLLVLETGVVCLSVCLSEENVWA